MNLQEQGFRFVCRGKDFKWLHPSDKQPGDIDCTDMPDDEMTDLFLERNQRP